VQQCLSGDDSELEEQVEEDGEKLVVLLVRGIAIATNEDGEKVNLNNEPFSPLGACRQMVAWLDLWVDLWFDLATAARSRGGDFAVVRNILSEYPSAVVASLVCENRSSSSRLR
jgi:hypothetical protein